MAIERAKRMGGMGAYLFAEIDRKRREKEAAGADVINLGVGDPDRPTVRFVVEAMREAVQRAEYHQYPSGVGLKTFREAAARFMKRRYGVEVDPASEVIATLGSKDGIAHLPLGVVNTDEVVLVPNPGYPVYRSGAIFAAARPWAMDLEEDRGWLFDLEAIPEDVKKQARLIWVNYPNNPTAATANIEFCEKLVWHARKYDWVIASDMAYGEVYFGDKGPCSVLEAAGVKGARERTIEFHSLSKTFNMTGWRLGFAVGGRELIGTLGAVKSHCDSGVFGAIQAAGATALDRFEDAEVKAMVDLYRERRDVLCEGLTALSLEVEKPEASFFVWGKCPKGEGSMAFAERMLEEAGVVVVPGGGFAKHCDGYFRAALTVEVDRLREAVRRMGEGG